MILLTGTSGFLGHYIQRAFFDSNDEVVSLKEITLDISKPFSIEQPFDRVLHCAGLAHNKARNDEQLYAVNLQGTINLCNALEDRLPKQFVFISTVAVYGLEEGIEINEQYPLLGSTAYARSKIEAEAFLAEWCAKHAVKLLILRLPLVVGVNPPGNLGKMISSIQKGTYHRIGKGAARKSMVLASDVAQLILNNPEAAGIYNLTDGKHPSFYELEQHICNELGLKMSWALPYRLIWVMAKIGDLIPNFPLNSLLLAKLTRDLTFDDAKAKKELNWAPREIILNWKNIK